MRTRMATTSLLAYENLRQSGKEQTQKARILNEIIKHPNGLTRRQLAAVSGMELSAVCGRVNSLSEDGLVDESEDTKCAFTGKTVKLIKPVSDDESQGWLF